MFSMLWSHICGTTATGIAVPALMQIGIALATCKLYDLVEDGAEIVAKKRRGPKLFLEKTMGAKMRIMIAFSLLLGLQMLIFAGVSRAILPGVMLPLSGALTTFLFAREGYGEISKASTFRLHLERNPYSEVYELCLLRIPAILMALMLTVRVDEIVTNGSISPDWLRALMLVVGTYSIAATKASTRIMGGLH